MNAARIVSVLLGEGLDPEEFVGSIPPETWASYHIIRNGEHNVFAGDKWDDHPGLHLVYKNNEDGTRDFIGFIAVVTGAPKGDYWVVQAVAKPRPGMTTQIRKFYTGTQHPTMNDAARELYRRYLGQ
jgi:hypothetical protein